MGTFLSFSSLTLNWLVSVLSVPVCLCVRPQGSRQGDEQETSCKQTNKQKMKMVEQATQELDIDQEFTVAKF